MRLADRPYTKQPWYSIYTGMKSRCFNENATNYKNYGGRGITVCEEWLNVGEFAKWCELSGYQKGLSLDRIDVNGNYEPSNCRWATPKQQANNTRRNIKITIDGVTKTLSEWADFAGISFRTVSSRYHDQGVRGIMLLRKAEDTKFKSGKDDSRNLKRDALGRFSK